MKTQTAPLPASEEFLGEELTPWQRVRRNLAANRLAMGGSFFLLLFFAVALTGWWGTSGPEPYFNPSQVRLPDKLKPPLSPPSREVVPPGALPRLGVYFFGTDELGRDVFARMLEGATVSMAVGFVAVGIAVVLGVVTGGVAGFYGERVPGGAPLFGFLAGPGVGFALWRGLGVMPMLGACLGGLVGLRCRRGGRSLALEGLVLGLLAGAALSPLGPKPVGFTASPFGLTVPNPGGLEFSLALAVFLGFAILGAILGGGAEEERPASLLLGAFVGGAAAYGGTYYLGFFYAYPGWLAHWAIALAGAAAGAGLVRLLDIGPRLRRWRLPRVDTIFVMLVDVQLSFPTFFLILTVIALLPPSIWNVMVVIGVTGWVGPARFVRAEILSLRERPFIEAAVALGGSDLRLIFRHLVPNSLAPVLVSATIGIAGAILVEAALSFLGFGVPPPQATWGNILSDGKKYLFDAPWLTFIPGTAILVVVLAFNLFGEGLRDALNPRVRA